jgi:hypothetical protein
MNYSLSEGILPPSSRCISVTKRYGHDIRSSVTVPVRKVCSLQKDAHAAYADISEAGMARKN